MKKQIRRHGEIIITPVDKIPEGARLVETGKSLIVGHSETGHNHVLTLPKTSTANLSIFEFEGKTYLDIPLEAKLTHQKDYEKHETQTVEAGIVEFHPRQSYSYAEKIMRRVQD